MIQALFSMYEICGLVFVFILAPILPLAFGTMAGIYHAFDKMKLSGKTALQTGIFAVVSFTVCAGLVKASAEATTITVTLLTTMFFFASWLRDWYTNS